MKEAFSSFPLEPGMLYDYKENKFPTRLHAFREDKVGEFNEPNSSYYGFVFNSANGTRARLQTASGRVFELDKGMYFASNEPLVICNGVGIVIERMMQRTMNMVGGPVEDKGRLKYIDGCTDSLLIPPVKKGDPCLNSLHFPEGIDQTMHTHPSMRVGMVSKGDGVCITPEKETPLYTGQVFIIHEEGEHKFRTEKGQQMTVIAYHPDSDFGPEDEEHPMINRTIVGGVSAKKLDAIRTK